MISFEVAQLDGPPASRLSAGNPCQSDVMVPLLQKDDSCYWAKDGECDSPPNCLEGTDTTDCDGSPPVSCSLSVPASSPGNMTGRVVISRYDPSSPCSVQDIVTRAEQGNAECLIFAGKTLASLNGVQINLKSGQLSHRDWEEHKFSLASGQFQNVDVREGTAGVTMQLSEFSSKGPTPDGRFKPDVVAVGEIYSADSDGVLNAATSDCREAFMAGIYLLQ